jgi:hypothetical protein
MCGEAVSLSSALQYYVLCVVCKKRKIMPLNGSNKPAGSLLVAVSQPLIL